MRRIGLAWLGLVIISLGAGCEKSETTRNQPEAAPPAPVITGETVARLHWIGLRRLAGDRSATNLLAIWHLPASERLLAQTLEKFSTAPWRFAQGGEALTNAAALTNSAAAQLRPLLDDLVTAESFLEVRQGTNQTSELAFAIRLSEERARLWETNLAAVLESLTSHQRLSTVNERYGWALKQPRAPQLIELVRAGEWTLVGAAPVHNALLDEMLARLRHDRAPGVASRPDDVVEGEFDLRRIATALSVKGNPSSDWPRVSVTVRNESKRMLTRCVMDFSQPLIFELAPWNIPTNLVQEPLTSFSVVRGIGKCLGSQKVWKDLQLGAPPNQFSFWAEEGLPVQMYFAAPLADASNQVHAVSRFLVEVATPWLSTNTLAGFTWSADSSFAVWTGVPFMTPFLRAVDTSGGSFVFGGMFRNDVGGSPPPGDLLWQFLGRTNLVYYDWELTGARTEAWIYSGQLLRLVFGNARMSGKSASITWLKDVATKLGNCATEITVTGSNQLTLVRRSTVGLTGVELHLLADWLESPQFPVGLHTLDTPPDEATKSMLTTEQASP